MKTPRIIIAVASILLIAAITPQPVYSQGKGKGKNTITPTQLKNLKDARDAAAKEVIASEPKPEHDPGGRIKIAEDGYELAIVNFYKARAAAKKASKDDKKAAWLEAKELGRIAKSATPKREGMTNTQCGEASTYRDALRKHRKAKRAYELGMGMELVYPPGDPNDPAYGGPEETDPLSAGETGDSTGIFSLFGGQSVAAQSARNAATTAVRAARPRHVTHCRN